VAIIYQSLHVGEGGVVDRRGAVDIVLRVVHPQTAPFPPATPDERVQRRRKGESEKKNRAHSTLPPFLSRELGDTPSNNTFHTSAPHNTDAVLEVGLHAYTHTRTHVHM
jgi:hypothetical protein